MRRALDETKLRTISGRRGMYVDGQRDCLSAKWPVLPLTFQEAMTLSPVGVYIHSYRTPRYRSRKYGIQ